MLGAEADDGKRETILAFDVQCKSLKHSDGSTEGRQDTKGTHARLVMRPVLGVVEFSEVLLTYGSLCSCARGELIDKCFRIKRKFG